MLSYSVHKTIVFQLCVFSTIIILVRSYNVEVDKVGFARGEKGSQFGYSVAIVKEPGWTSAGTNVPFFNKILLAGAPNETYNNIRGHGQIHKCLNPEKSSTVSCESMNVVEETKLCTDRLMSEGNSNCATDSRLGMTMKVNKHYKKNKNNHIVPMVTVCAPAWKNVFPEIKDLQNYMIGLCLKLRENLTTIACDTSKTVYNRMDLGYCWPFWPTKDKTTLGGRPVYTYAEGGMSAGFSENGMEVIGGPGAYDWRGAYRSYGNNWTYALTSVKVTTLYFGYALVVGKFKNANVAVGAPNYYSKNSGYFGKVDMFNNVDQAISVSYGLPFNSDSCKDIESVLDLNALFDVDQTGTKFGAVIEAVDLTGDGYDELLVASPLYSGERPDEGRVFVYTTTKLSVCGPIGILSGGARQHSLKEMSAFARFGSSIAAIGDLNKDGINDVAIGAPYEDDGSGAVYIYHGMGNVNSIMKDQFSQRIAGSKVDPGIQSFGWSIHGEEDIDDNSYPDFAVGAYRSDTVALFRTRPIVKVNVQIDISPRPIPLDGSQLDCSLDKRMLCFNVNVSFSYQSLGKRNGDVDEITFSWTLNADTVYKSGNGYSRIVFRGISEDVWNENITLSNRGSNTMETRHYIMDVKGYNGEPEPQDAWTLIRLEGTYQLLGQNDFDFTKLDPILPEDDPAKIIENVEFDKKCDSIDLCTSDLTIHTDMFLLKRDKMPIRVVDDTVIYVDQASELEITVDVKNLFNSSYRANFSGEVTSVMRRDILSNNGIIGSACKYEKIPTKAETVMNCTADSKLDKNENFKVKFYFDISRVQLIPNLNLNYMMKSIVINYTAQQINQDVNLKNNKYTREIPIALKYDVSIEEDKEISAQEKYSANTKSPRKIHLIHKYFITNNGPSFLPLTYINITIPTQHGGLTIATILREKLPNVCQVRGHSPNVQTTTKAPTTSTEYFTIPDTNVEKRRRRDVPEEPKVAKSTAASDKAVMNITCTEGSEGCAIIECRISNLERDQQQTLELAIDIDEKEIAKEKDVRMIRYITKATVTDPHIWYGSKVVPWKDTVFAKKTTLLVVETDSVINEVDIWIIIGAVLGAITLLVIVVVILYLCGFFNRKKHSEIQQWKKTSLYNRKSMRLSKTMNQPYNAVENMDE